MQGSTNRGPAMYFGWCHRTNQYRMMDLPDYMSNTQEGMSRLMNNSAAAYQNMYAGYGGQGGTATMPQQHQHQHGKDCGCGCGGKHRDCGCNDRHCECCVCDADVLIHARCGEIRRIPLTFENDTRRDKPITLELGKFLTQSGKDLGWSAQLTETQFTLRPCDENTVSLLVAIRCKTDDTKDNPNTPQTTVPGTKEQAAGAAAPTASAPPANAPAANRLETNLSSALSAIDERIGKVDKCEVGYATIRAEGCLTRPIVVAIAVLPEDCDAFRHPCGCSCCH